MPLRKVKKRIGYVLFLFVFTCIAAEILLRIHNPFATSVTGDEVTLHTNTTVIVQTGPNSNGLDESVTVRKNSLAFRGPEPPSNFKDHLTIIAVGGSTTECLFIPEEKTWPHLLQQKLRSSFPKVWINNAGLNGHSTYGHLKLMQEYIVKLQPDYCLFLVGCNDVNRKDLTDSDRSIDGKEQKFIVQLAKYSRLANVGLNIYRHHLAGKRALVNNRHFSLKDREKIVLHDSIIQRKLHEQAPLLQQYRRRIRSLIDECRRANIQPLFITQPCLLGEGKDDLTGVDLATFPHNEGNGKLVWEMLKLYNAETLSVCNENNVHVIDLASQMPKSSRYFYDSYHYNNEGCKKISELLHENLVQYFSEKN